MPANYHGRRRYESLVAHSSSLNNIYLTPAEKGFAFDPNKPERDGSRDGYWFVSLALFGNLARAFFSKDQVVSEIAASLVASSSIEALLDAKGIGCKKTEQIETFLLAIIQITSE